MAIYFLFGIVFWNFMTLPKEIVYGIDTIRNQKSTMNLKFIKNTPFKKKTKEIN
jgi:hypothetical protein